MRRFVVALSAVALVFPASFIAVVVLPATPAHAEYMENWWIYGRGGEENNPNRPDVEFQVCSMKSWGVGVPITVDYSTSDGTATAGSDYVAAAGTLIFLPTQMCQVVKVRILDDDEYEVNDDWEADYFWGEYFHFDLSNPGPGSPPIDEYGHAFGSIEDDIDDWPAALISDDKALAEGGNVGIPVRLDWEKKYPVTVHYEMVSESASAGDFVVSSGDITFEPGETRKYVLGVANQDALNEESETFRLDLSNNQPVDKTWIYKGSVNTITDDDPLPRISVDDVSITDATNAPFTVSLTAPSGRDVTVDYSTKDLSATARDYVPTSGTLTFPAGTTSQTVSVPVYRGTATEGTRQFALGLETPLNAAIDRAEGTATIEPLPPAPATPVPPTPVDEGRAVSEPPPAADTLVGSDPAPTPPPVASSDQGTSPSRVVSPARRGVKKGRPGRDAGGRPRVIRSPRRWGARAWGNRVQVPPARCTTREQGGCRGR